MPVDLKQRLMVAARYDFVSERTRQPTKDILRWCWCRHEDGREEWRCRAPPKPWPLWNLGQLATRPSAPVLIVEGEKAALAAEEMLTDYVVTTFSGGTAGTIDPKNHDWHPLAGRVCWIWMDADEPGREAAIAVEHHLWAVDAAAIFTIETADLPKGWDLADA